MPGPSRPSQVLLAIAAGLLLVLGGLAGGRWMFGRERSFRAQAELGQPIVRAIEQYRVQTGRYPASLAALVPDFLSLVPQVPDRAQHQFSGWDYQTETNAGVVTYSLRYYLGRGGVEYRPPRWIGNDEGHRKILLSNE